MSKVSMQGAFGAPCLAVARNGERSSGEEHRIAPGLGREYFTVTSSISVLLP